MKECEYIIMKCLRVEENRVSVSVPTSQETKVPS